jgi:inosose dehydratase
MSTILVGSAPDSWGVWFSDDLGQTPYGRFLDEVAASGYEWVELGAYGYLPTDPQRLSDELAARNLKLSARTVFEHLHQDGSWDAVWTQIEEVARLTAAAGGKHVVVIPEMWRDPTVRRGRQARRDDRTAARNPRHATAAGRAAHPPVSRVLRDPVHPLQLID